MATPAHPPSVRDNCSFASGQQWTRYQKLGCHHGESVNFNTSTMQATTGQTTRPYNSTAPVHPPSVRDNCSFASGQQWTLRLEVSEVGLSSRRVGQLQSSIPCKQRLDKQQCLASKAPVHPPSVRDNCSFASGQLWTLRLEVSEVGLSSRRVGQLQSSIPVPCKQRLD